MDSNESKLPSWILVALLLLAIGIFLGIMMRSISASPISTLTPTPTLPVIAISPTFVLSTNPELEIRWRIEPSCTSDGKVIFATVTMLPLSGSPPYEYEIDYSPSNTRETFQTEDNTPVTFKIDGGSTSYIRITASDQTGWVRMITIPQVDQFCAILRVTQNQLGQYSLSDIKVGNLSFYYPIWMQPGNSSLVTLSLQTSEITAKVESAPSIVPLPTDIPIATNKFGTFIDQLLLAPEMRVELTTQNFDVQPQFSDTIKQMDLQGKSTEWSWLIKAPETLGTHVIVLKIFLDNAEDPVFLRAFEIGVAPPTEIPTNSPLPPTSTNTPTITPVIPTVTQTLTPTPLPVIQRIGNRMIDSFEIVLGAILVFVGSMAGIYFQYIRPAKKKSKNKK